jgi:hypothetical protein
VIAVDGRLRAAAVWGNLGDPTPGGDSGQVAGAVRRGGGGWSAPRALDPDAPPPPMGTLLWPKATVALDGDGTAVAVFNRVTGPAFATLGPDGAPSPPRLLGGRLAGWSTLQTDGTGGLLLVLRTPRGLELRSWRPGQEWTPARAVAGSSKANSPALAARSGGAILAWAQFRGTGSTPLQVRAALGRRVDSASRTEAP